MYNIGQKKRPRRAMFNRWLALPGLDEPYEESTIQSEVIAIAVKLNAEPADLFLIVIRNIHGAVSTVSPHRFRTEHYFKDTVTIVESIDSMPFLMHHSPFISGL